MAQNICKTGHLMDDDKTFCQICGQISTTDPNAAANLVIKAANNVAPPSTVKKQSK
jgi:RNA polymerase subunit RPABC4/transcription elongation factor Spt4